MALGGITCGICLGFHNAHCRLFGLKSNGWNRIGEMTADEVDEFKRRFGRTPYEDPFFSQKNEDI